MPRMLAGAGLVLVLAACGGERLSLSEYNAQGQALVTVMEERIASLDAQWASQTPSVERARTYWELRQRARVEALEGFQVLDPPDALADLHKTGIDLYRRLIAAEEALAVRVTSFEAVTEPEQWWNTAEGAAVRSAEGDINEICRAFQASYDATIARLAFSDVSWIPSEMKEIVRIDLGCQP